jgi:hypothetical protein
MAQPEFRVNRDIAEIRKWAHNVKTPTALSAPPGSMIGWLSRARTDCPQK